MTGGVGKLEDEGKLPLRLYRVIVVSGFPEKMYGRPRSKNFFDLNHARRYARKVTKMGGVVRMFHSPITQWREFPTWEATEG